MTRYEDLDALNWSRLKQMRTSPKHYKHALTVARKDTPAMQLGRATHAALYEPETFETRYLVYPGPVRRGKQWEEFKEYNAGADIITLGQKTEALAIATAVREDEVAGPILEGIYVEQVLTWHDRPEHPGGRKCKGRIDQVNGRLGDLKTTSKMHRFASQVEELGYLGQLAFYSDGLHANGIAVDDLPVIIAVESAEPYDVVVYEIDEEQLDSGRMLYRRLMAELEECEMANTWPGRAGGKIQPLRRPMWAVDAEANQRLKLTYGGEPVEIT